MYSDYEEQYEEPYDEFFSALLSFFDYYSEGTVKMIDFDRYAVLMKTAAELKQILSETDEQGELEIELDERFDMGTISTRLNDLTVMDPSRFAAMIAAADSFEIYPRTDGTLQLNIAFRSVLKTIGKEENK